MVTSSHGVDVNLVEQHPVTIRAVAPGVMLADFGRVAFGNIRLAAPAGAAFPVRVHFGEALAEGRINRSPPGSVRYGVAQVRLGDGVTQVVAPPADERTIRPAAAVRTPGEWGVVMPFRWVEVEGWPDGLAFTGLVRRAAFAASWDDQAAAFSCSDPMLDRIWDLCRYSIKATTFAGVYVDGDRERIAYEGDAYLNQLAHYACDPDYRMARATFDRLLEFPTWPTEWAFHLIFMAHADWMQTGDRAWLAARYQQLKPKLLLERAREDGLLVSNAGQMDKGDLVDWPPGERDGFVFTPVNTVVNAFYAEALRQMAELASALGRDVDSARFAEYARRTRMALQARLFDPVHGRYRDGESADHTSQHASLFPLAFGLAPEEGRVALAAWLAGRGMRCSVYAAHYLLTGLFEQGLAREALALMQAPGDRSWRHMVESGATITWEAWDQVYKPNQDWNHAWGAAPAHLLPRYVLGVRPSEPGWAACAVRPQSGHLSWAGGRVPTPRGPVDVRWEAGPPFQLRVTVPPGMRARLEIPAPAGAPSPRLNGQPVASARRPWGWLVSPTIPGPWHLQVP